LVSPQLLVVRREARWSSPRYQLTLVAARCWRPPRLRDEGGSLQKWDPSNIKALNEALHLFLIPASKIELFKKMEQ
jgi:hypothetical protein